MPAFRYRQKSAELHQLLVGLPVSPVFALFLSLAFTAQSALPASAADRPAAKTDLSLEESLAAFRLAPELKIEIVAVEPAVVSPVSMAFDEQGRLWVVEMSDYPNGPTSGEPPKSRIKLLEDADADGRFETAHIFADKLLFATGVQPWRGGVIVTLAGEIAYFKDTDGDGRANVRETWFRGFAQENSQLRANHPQFAPDGYVYVANGLRGGTIVANSDKWGRVIPPVSISGKDFRFDPITGECQAVSGNGQFGLTFDDFGNRFVCSNRNPCRHVVLEDRYLKRNPFLAVRDVAQDVLPAAEKSRIYPISRVWTTSNLHAGQFTAACGVLIYRGRSLPKDAYYGNVFVCEPTANLVHREILEPVGPTFQSRAAQEGVEFLASSDEWFRPVDLANGPDGALYVVDMHRAVIEHPEWVPAELKNRPDLYDGSDRGRIYRIVSREQPADQALHGRLSLAGLPLDELAKSILHEEAWRRETAARLIIERQSAAAMPILVEIANDGSNSAASRILSLSLLNRLGGLSDELLESAMLDQVPRVRDHALALAEPRLRRLPQLREALMRAGAAFSFHAALALGELDLEEGDKSRASLELLARILLDNADDEWMRAAVLSSAGAECHRLAGLILKQDRDLNERAPEKCRAAVKALFEVIGARNEPPEIAASLSAVLSQAAGSEPEGATLLRIVAANSLGRGLARRGESFTQIRERFAQLDGTVAKGLDPVFGEAGRLAGDGETPNETRLEAIGLLRFAPFQIAGPVLLELARSDRLQEIRLSAIDELATFQDPAIGPALLADLSAQTPAVRRRIVQAMLRDSTRTKEFLAEIEARNIAASEIDAAGVQMLTNNKDDAIREQARRILAAAIPADRKKVLAEYQPALALKADAGAGRAIFEKSCTNCHKIGNLGIDVAPDISDSRTKTPAQLLTDILSPNQAIDNNYVSYTVVTKSGKTETGVIAAETASSITLRQPEGKVVLILRQEIDELRSNGVSLMPEGLEKDISVKQMADLISFIKNWRYLDGQVPLGK